MLISKKIYKECEQLPPAIVLGLGQNGLATVRALARRGVPVIGIDRNLKQFTAATRYCAKLYFPGFSDAQKLAELLVELGKELPQKAVLFPSGDGNLYNVSQKRDMLKDYYHFTFPEKDIVELALNKKKFYQFAREKGFPIPQTFFSEEIDNIHSLSREIRYPCIIKPFQPNLGWRQLFPDQKLFQARDKQEFLDLYERLVKVHSDLLIQQLIPGPENKLSFSLTYFNSQSESLGMFTGNKIRQHPPYFGTSCLAESRWHQDVADRTIEVLKAINYTGYGSIEFKWDDVDNVNRIIELTARTWFPHGISAACGLELEYIAYCDKLDIPLPQTDSFREGVKWIHEERDIKTSLFYMKKKELTPGQWLKSYQGKRTFALTAWDDPMPALSLAGQAITYPFRKISKLLT
jgi:predicted ATP-grasp superfamily ATP-dependent carboligase